MKQNKNLVKTFYMEEELYLGEIKTFIDFESTSAVEIPHAGAKKHTATCMAQ